MSSQIQLHAAYSSLRIRGVTEVSVLQRLLDLGVKHFVFDANPLSLQFVPNYLMQEMAALIGQHKSEGARIQWALSFNESQKASVQHYLELLALDPKTPRPILESPHGSIHGLNSIQLVDYEYGCWAEASSQAEMRRELSQLFSQCRYLVFSQEHWKKQEQALDYYIVSLKSGAKSPLCLIISLSCFGPFYQSLFFRLQKFMATQQKDFTRPIEWIWELKITSEVEQSYRKVEVGKLQKAIDQLAQSIIEL